MTIAVKSFRLGVILVSLWAAATTQPKAGAQSQSSEAAPISIALSAVSTSIRAGSPVLVKIVTTNTSDHTLTLWLGKAADQAGWSYGAVVHDENGKAPPDTVFGRSMKYTESPNQSTKTSPMFNGAYRELKPGESHTIVSDIGRLYDFSQPGTYEIYVRQSAGADGAPERLVNSNTIVVTVNPASSAPSTSNANLPTGPAPFKLTVSPSNITIHEKTPGAFSRLNLEVTTENISSRNVVLWAAKFNQEQAGAAYQVSIKNLSGKPLPDTQFGLQAKGRKDVPTEANPGAFSGSVGERLVLKPGESWSDTINIEKLYEVSQPGEYVIQVERFDPATKTMVKANPITLTVTP